MSELSLNLHFGICLKICFVIAYKYYSILMCRSNCSITGRNNIFHLSVTVICFCWQPLAGILFTFTGAQFSILQLHSIR